MAIPADNIDITNEDSSRNGMFHPALTGSYSFGCVDEKLNKRKYEASSPSQSGDQNRNKKKQRHATPETSNIKIACKARGLPESHNSNTAFIQIPENCLHGQMVLCSHPECVRSGRQFRYCAVCRLPVAKRNFMKRHSHGEFASPDELREKLGESGKRNCHSTAFISDKDADDESDIVCTEIVSAEDRSNMPKLDRPIEVSDHTGQVQNRDSLSSWLSDIFRGSDPLYPRKPKATSSQDQMLQFSFTKGGKTETDYPVNGFSRPDTSFNELDLSSIFD
mmetsp:Transcript_15123/g.21867  ORF Transcript_15123/g.21867 Transcript_15123/m.21867 type:complete len:278 (-) Transcript_15123:714-1547(-)